MSTPSYATRRLEQRRIGSTLLTSREYARDVEDRMLQDQLLHRLEAFVLTEQLAADTQRVTFEVPASWWQHWRATRRRRWRWQQRRLLKHPIQYATVDRTVTVTRSRMYPEADVARPPLGGPVYFDEVSFGGPGRWEP